MAWLHAVQERILQKIYTHPTAQQQLLEAILWRGWMASESKGRILLARIATKTDLRDQETLAAFTELEVIPLDDLFDHCAEVRWRKSDEIARREALSRIVRLPSPEGMTGIFEHPDFDYDFPATELDQGVALLVRAINRRGTRTRVSGHGDGRHGGRCRLFVEFADETGGRVFERVFEEDYVHRLTDPHLFSFVRTELGDLKLVIGTETDAAAQAFRYFKAAQELGRMI